MVDEDRAVGPVVVVVKVDVGLHFSEVRQHPLEAPLFVAQGRPSVEIVRHAPVEGRCVDGAGTSGYLASGNSHGWCLAGGFTYVLPIVPAVEEGNGMPGRSP